MKTKPALAIIWCLAASALILGQAAQQKQPAPEKQLTTTAIPGVVAAGVKVERVWTGMRAADGVISEPDGTLLLPEQRADRISKGAAAWPDSDTSGSDGSGVCRTRQEDSLCHWSRK